jgi:hypothetical protein
MPTIATRLQPNPQNRENRAPSLVYPRRLHPGNGARRVYSRIFLARLLLVLDSIRDVLDALLTTLAPPDRWVASDHEALLADGAGGA